jgi:hypothetical protein
MRTKIHAAKKSSANIRSFTQPLTDADGAQTLELASNARWQYDQALPAALRGALDRIRTGRSRYGDAVTPIVKALAGEARRLEQLLKTGCSDAVAGVARTTAGSVSAAKDAKDAGDELIKTANVDLRTITGGGTLSSSPYAYVVSKAPEAVWSSTFNKATGSGSLGNTDIVLKMNSQGDFSVKGMRFDATTVAMVASKVMTQAILLGAGMAGVPIPTSASNGATGTGKDLADAGGLLAANDETVAKRKAATDAWKQAIREMSTALLSERDALASDAEWASRKAAVQASFKATLDALEPTLKFDSVQ